MPFNFSLMLYDPAGYSKMYFKAVTRWRSYKEFSLFVISVTFLWRPFRKWKTQRAEDTESPPQGRLCEEIHKLVFCGSALCVILISADQCRDIWRRVGEQDQTPTYRALTVTQCEDNNRRPVGEMSTPAPLESGEKLSPQVVCFLKFSLFNPSCFQTSKQIQKSSSRRSLKKISSKCVMWRLVTRQRWTPKNGLLFSNKVSPVWDY